MQAALEVSAESGPQDISLRGLARKLGVTTAAPYHHLRDKGELLLLLAIEGYSRLLEQLQAAETKFSAPAKNIDSLTRAYLQFGREEPGYYRIMFLREVAQANNVMQLEEPAAQCFDLVRGVIAKANKSLSSDQVSERTVSVWSFLHGMLLLSLSGPLARRLAPEHEDRVAIETVMRIIRG
jgi:AcrR family transcriptional regulator